MCHQAIKNHRNTGEANAKVPRSQHAHVMPLPQDIELEDLQLAICGLECFVATKLAAQDPTFIQQHTDLIAY